MNILIVYPHGNALNVVSGASARVYSLIKFLVKNNFKITILHSIEAKGYEDIYLKEKCKVYYYKQLKFRGIPDWYITDLNPFFIWKLIHIIQKERFDLVQLEYLWGFFITKLIIRNKTFLIYDSQGVEGEFIKLSIKNPNFPKILKPIAGIYAKTYEKFSCKLANMIINVSNLDRNYYINNYNLSKNKLITISIPSIVEVQKLDDAKKMKLKCRKKLSLPPEKILILFHGSLPHPANQEAFDLIKNYIARNINDPEIIFILAGKNVLKFKNENIIYLGFVNNLEYLLYSADFAIVPIISGSGMRVKCMDYITTGLPFITTKKGIEGIDFLKDKIDCLICDGVNDNFLSGIIKLSKDSDYRDFLHQNLLKKSNLINQESVHNRFIKLYECLKKYSQFL